MVSAVLTIICAIAFLLRLLHGASDADPWRNCFKGILVGLSDLALVTGLSITIATFVFGLTSMDTYHFKLALDLASISVAVHLFSAMVLYLDYKDEVMDKLISGADDTDPSHTSSAVWLGLLMFRRIWMYMTLVLIWILWFLNHFNNPPNCPAGCSSPATIPPTNWQRLRKLMVFSTLPNSLFFLVLVESQPIVDPTGTGGNWRTRWTRRLHRWRKWISWTCYSISLTWAFASCFCELSLIIHDYWESLSYFSDKQRHAEHKMGFGQIIPLILLILPFMAAATAYHGKSLSTLHVRTRGDSHSQQKASLSLLLQTTVWYKTDDDLLERCEFQLGCCAWIDMSGCGQPLAWACYLLRRSETPVDNWTLDCLLCSASDMNALDV